MCRSPYRKHIHAQPLLPLVLRSCVHPARAGTGTPQRKDGDDVGDGDASRLVLPADATWRVISPGCRFRRLWDQGITFVGIWHYFEARQQTHALNPCP